MMSETGLTRSFVSNGEVMLHALWRGHPGKPMVVFANSLGTDARIWDAVVSRLPDAYGILLYDKRGHGLSDAPRGPYTIDDHARDLLGLLDHVGVRRCAIVGLSVGGMIAQAVAAGHPDRVAALVLCDTAARIGDAATWNARIEAVERQRLETIGDSVMERWFTPTYRTQNPAAVRGWRTMLTRQSAQGYAATCATVRDADLRAASATIRVPTLCVVGEQDLSTPPDLVRGTAELIPNARFEVIPDAGHIPCVEQPGALATLIIDHLDRAGFR